MIVDVLNFKAITNHFFRKTHIEQRSMLFEIKNKKIDFSYVIVKYIFGKNFKFYKLLFLELLGDYSFFIFILFCTSFNHICYSKLSISM